ncbi:MAG: GNAT family N-acetyltransferase [Saprospiraceae bacterium]|nr:GNAT family N-acetyltransferase [Saprospiraceae bacterium]
MNIIETRRLRLVPVVRTDIADIHQMNSIPDVARFNTIGIPGNIEVTEKMLEKLFDEKQSSTRGWTIRRQFDDQFIGVIGMNLAAERFRMAEMHYSLLPDYWGQGYATEAVRGLIGYAFEELGLHRLEAGVATGNLASIRVLEKAGMTREGLKRKILPIRGTWVDNFHYAILDEDERDY